MKLEYPDLFAMRYPVTAGSKTGGTSAEAAVAMSPKVQTLCALCYDVLRDRPMTADETAARLGLSVLSIRPRFSNLVALGKIEKTGQRRRNISGLHANVYRIKP